MKLPFHLVKGFEVLLLLLTEIRVAANILIDMESFVCYPLDVKPMYKNTINCILPGEN